MLGKLKHTRRHSKRKKVSILFMLKVVIVMSFPIIGVTLLAREVYEYKVPSAIESKLDTSVSVKKGGVVAGSETSVSSKDNVSKKIEYKVGVVSDSHNQNELLAKSLGLLKNVDVAKVVFLGDYTDWGELDALARAKETMDNSDLSYVSLPGDHDLGETRDTTNFVQVFGTKSGVFNVGSYKFLYFDNSLNFTEIPTTDMVWFAKEVIDSYCVLLSQPLVSKDMTRVMGVIAGVKDVAVFPQNQELLTAIRKSDVRVIIAGDLHTSSQYQDPEKPGLWHVSAGAVLKSENIDKLNLQSSRVGVLEIYDDKSWVFKDILL